MEFFAITKGTRVTAVELKFLVFATFTFLLVASPPLLADSGPPWAGTTVDDLSYSEGEGWKRLDTEVTVTSSTDDFTNGYIEIEIPEGTSYDELRLVDGEALSLDGNGVYWNGERVGTIDGSRDGSAGKLRIDFHADAPLENAGFETGDLSGWTIDTVWNQMWGQKWAEGPDSLGYTGDSDPTYDDQNSGSGAAEVNSGAAYEGDYGLDLEMTGGVASAYGTGHAPSATSSTFAAESGDSLTLRWKAAGTDAYYDVFGFVFADTDGDGRMIDENYQLLFHEIGKDSDGWKTLSTSLMIGGENLRLKFLNGCYDRAGDGEVGSYLYIDGISFQTSGLATDGVVQSIIEHVEYQNTSDNPAATKTYNLHFEESDGETGNNSAEITIARENDPPTGMSLSSDNVDENQPSGTVIGTLSTIDPDDTNFRYSLVGGNVGAFRIDGDKLETATELDFEFQSTYEVQVRTKDGNGATYSDTFTISVDDVNDPPDASFACSPDNPDIGDSIEFDAGASLDSDGSIDIYRWDWSNDGTYETSLSTPTASHSYPDRKEYTVKLQVVDDDGEVDSATREVDVDVNTEKGKNVEVEFDSQSFTCGCLRGVKLKYQEVTSPGSTEVSEVHEPPFATTSGITFSECFYRLETTASFQGDVVLEISYDDSKFTFNREANLKLFQLTDGEKFDDITKSIDKEKDVAAGEADDLSYFSLGYGSGSIEGERMINHGPNPVPEEGCIFWLDLPDTATGATLTIYGIDGKPLYRANLDEDQLRYPSAGRWKPRDRIGQKLGSGVYLYRLKVKNGRGSSISTETHKLAIDRSD